MTLGTILLIILILLLIGAIPIRGTDRRGWGYGPSGIVGVILVIVIILLVMGRL